MKGPLDRGNDSLREASSAAAKKVVLWSILALAAPLQAVGQTYPTQPVKILVGFPPGGGVDIVARVLAQKLAEVWGQSVIVDNRAGANGIIASELLAKSPPNGYTLLLSSPGALVISPNLGTKLSYDPIRDFAPITVISESAALLVVNPSVPASSVKELIAYAKSKPAELTYASSGTGGPNHMAGELFKSLAGIEMTHVPYKGSSPALTDLIGGQVKVMFGVIPALIPFVNSGKLKALGVGGPRRSVALPNLPTIAEAGLPGYDLTIWYGMVAPKNTPVAIINSLNATLVKILRSPDMQSILLKGGSEPVGNTPEQFAEYLKEENAKYAKLVKLSGATSQ